MARSTHVKAARRRYTEDETGIDGGIKKGQSYYWWKFRHGGKRYSLTAPSRSQLTQSSFYSTLYDIEDHVGDLIADSNLPSEIESLMEDLTALGEECEGNRDNMPESLQDSDTGQMLQERSDWCADKVQELEGIETDYEPADHGDDEPESDHWEAVLEEVQGIDFSSPN